MKKFKIFLINVLLFLIAILGVTIIGSVGFFVGIYYILFKKESTEYFKDCAYVLDIFGNVICQDLFDLILIKKESKFKFGNPQQTISAVLGLNKHFNTLKNQGIFWANFLNKIDKNHVERAAKRFL